MLSRESVTNVLEVVGCVLLALAGGVEVARWSLAGGIATGGGLLIVVSVVLSVLAPKALPRGDESA